jgi:BirA family biotin operon repressor/biotin-[acetyl-CoA-carboxylase] ligase
MPGPGEQVPVDSRLAGYSAGGALAVCESLEQEFGLKAEIKWPNDVLVDKKKVCGILVEAKWQGDRLQAVVLGVGVNLNRGEIPASARLDYPAGSIEESIIHSLKREAGQMLPVRRSELLEAILLNLLNWRDLIGGPAMIAAWESRLAYRGEQVVILHPGTGAVVHQGRLDGLNADGSLRLLNSENKPVVVIWGDLSLRPIDTI